MPEPGRRKIRTAQYKRQWNFHPFSETRTALRAVGLSWFTWLWLLSIYGAVIVGMCFLGATARPYYLAPYRYAGPTLIYAADGYVLAKLYAEYRVPVSIHQIPAHTIHAVLAAEDVRFFQHHGLDARGILRAVWEDIRAGELKQGGSTITQQLVRYELLSEQRSLQRKAREAVLAVRIERAYTKQQILERYLNAVYFGGGAYGIGAASQSYFGKRVEQLTPAESAVLAGLIRAPGEGNPRRNLPLILRRQRGVLAMMRKQGWLSQDEYLQACREQISIRPREANRWQAPYAVEYVRQTLLQRYGRETVYQGGMRVYTTIDRHMQQAAEHALRAAVAAGRAQHVGNGALVAVEPQTGYIKAIVGGADFWQSPFNRATQAHRQPGSAFKTFVYQAALDAGHSLNDVMLDAPITVNKWSPKNYGQHYHGWVTLQDALAGSFNSVAVRLVTELSPYAVINAAHEAGIDSPLRPDLTIALGSSEVTPLEMAHAFATYANDGQMVETSVIRKVIFHGESYSNTTPVAHQRVDPATAFLLTQGLEAVIHYGTGRRADIGRPAAGKTGTSSRSRDAWFVGYTPQLCAAVWLGNDDRRPMAGVTGGTLPAQAWSGFMRAALRGQPVVDFDVPYDVESVEICTVSHQLALPTCPSTQRIYVSLKNQPLEMCPIHQFVTVKICTESDKVANSTCPHTELRQFRYDDIPTEVCQINHREQATAPTAQPAPTTEQPVTPRSSSSTRPSPSTAPTAPAVEQPTPSTDTPSTEMPAAKPYEPPKNPAPIEKTPPKLAPQPQAPAVEPTSPPDSTTPPTDSAPDREMQDIPKVENSAPSFWSNLVAWFKRLLHGNILPIR